MNCCALAGTEPREAATAMAPIMTSFEYNLCMLFLLNRGPLAEAGDTRFSKRMASKAQQLMMKAEQEVWQSNRRYGSARDLVEVRLLVDAGDAVGRESRLRRPDIDASDADHRFLWTFSRVHPAAEKVNVARPVAIAKPAARGSLPERDRGGGTHHEARGGAVERLQRARRGKQAAGPGGEREIGHQYDEQHRDRDRGQRGIVGEADGTQIDEGRRQGDVEDHRLGIAERDQQAGEEAGRETAARL